MLLKGFLDVFKDYINVVILLFAVGDAVLFVLIYRKCRYVIGTIIEVKRPEVERSRPFSPGKSYITRLRENYEIWSAEYKACARYVHWYSAITSIFPLLGILGTVMALLSVGADFSGVEANFLVALTSTFWGLSAAVLFRFLESFFSHHFDRLKIYFEMFTKDMVALSEPRTEPDSTPT